MKITLFFILVAFSIPAMSDSGKWAIDTVQFDDMTADKIENGTMIKMYLDTSFVETKVIKFCKAGTIVVINNVVVCEKQEKREQHPRVIKY